MILKDMVRDEGFSIADVAAHLDSLADAERVSQVFTLGRSDQRALYQRAAASPDLTFEHFVPPGVEAGTEVRHRGKNTLPLPNTHKHFEKRFCRPHDGSPRLFGYNESPSRKLIGPGYFVTIPTASHSRWQERGALVVDYFRVPEASAQVPHHWPKIVPNEKGLQWFVYRHTRDFMRGVSKHVSIGAAFKGEQSLDHYFVLVRDPAADGVNQ